MSCARLAAGAWAPVAQLSFVRSFVSPVRCAATQCHAATASSPSAPASRTYPGNPLVAVGVFVFRPQTISGAGPEMLLIRRAKEPCKGEWSVPGGGQEVNETLQECAVRETHEETGISLLWDPDNAVLSGPELDSAGARSLAFPSVITAVDIIRRDDDGRPQYHYTIVEIAARASDPQQTAAPADDVDGVQWVPVNRLRQVENISYGVPSIAEEALRRFDIT